MTASISKAAKGADVMFTVSPEENYALAALTVKAAGMTGWKTGIDGIPDGRTVQDAQ